MDIELRERGSGFRALAARINELPKELRRELTKGIREDTKELEDAAKDAIRGTNSDAKTTGGGQGQREEHARSRSRTGRLPTSGGGHGLRNNIARGVTRKITFKGSRMGVRIRVDGKYLPASQKSLIHATNKGKWRHPAGWGRNRGSVWVEQTSTPPEWFDQTMREKGPDAIDKIDARARRVLGTLQG
jgi:hypothetical protein